MVRRRLTRITFGAFVGTCLVLLTASCDPPHTEGVVAHYEHPNPDLPFSEATRVDNVLFLSGQLGTVPGIGLVDGGIQAETQQAMENIQSVLERHGASMDDVVKCTVMLADIDEWPLMNEVYVTFFDNVLPARSAFATSGLALGGRVEIECIAAVSTLP